MYRILCYSKSKVFIIYIVKNIETAVEMTVWEQENADEQNRISRKTQGGSFVKPFFADTAGEYRLLQPVY